MPVSGSETAEERTGGGEVEAEDVRKFARAPGAEGSRLRHTVPQLGPRGATGGVSLRTAELLPPLASIVLKEDLA